MLQLNRTQYLCYLGYDLVYVYCSQTTPRVWVGYDSTCQTIPWVQFSYDLQMPNHTLRNEIACYNGVIAVDGVWLLYSGVFIYFFVSILLRNPHSVLLKTF